MHILFQKYHGTGNDFIMIDDRQAKFPEKDSKLIASLCHRHFGIGADGLILIREHPEHDFEMLYFNADGNTASLCGNGSRCAVVFALDIMQSNQQKVSFLASDGSHKAVYKNGDVQLNMQLIGDIEQIGNDFLLDTGSPHYILFRDEELENLDMVRLGEQVRYSNRFQAEGVNVNLVREAGENKIEVRTYERGVENETFSCGTGVVAAALASAAKNKQEGQMQWEVKTKGGELEVSFLRNRSGVIENIQLLGPACKVFEGSMKL